MASSVFSINNFDGGLDLRKTTLTAPGGTLRQLENAYVNSGGEIEKRLAFVTVATVDMTTTPPPYIFGQAGQIHVFGVGAAPAVNNINCPVPIVSHALDAPPEQIVKLIDCEAFDGKFQLAGETADGTTYMWYDGVLLKELDDSYSHGTFSRTYKTKMYRIDGKYLRFSGVNDPTSRDPLSTTNPGAGFINLAINDPDGEVLAAMEVYYGSMAIAARLLTQLWSLDPDPTNDDLVQLLRSGCIAPKSMIQFGTGDVLYLSDSGVRSLKAMNINLAASVSDVGSAIDSLTMAVVRDDPECAIKSRAVVQPIQGRYWLYLDGTIYVLSYYPAANITAWSTFIPDPGYEDMAEMIVCAENVYTFDDRGNIKLYGGTDGKTYDSCPVTIVTPHMHATGATENKKISSVDVMCEGAWSIEIGMLPNKPDLFELVANLQDNTYGLQNIPFAGYGTHIGVRLRNQAPGPAKLAAIHLNLLESYTKGGPSP